MALSDLEIVFELHLRNKLGEDDKAYIVGVLDTPESCSSWTTFKSYLAQNTGMSEDINVSYLDSEEDEVPICCENDYQCALDYFRHKARRGQRIVLKVYKRGLKSSGSPSLQGNAKLSSVRRLHLKKKSSGHYCVEETTESEEDTEEPPVWFTNYMKKFKGEISATIVNTMLTLLENGVVKHPQEKCCFKKKRTTNEDPEMPELICDDKLIRKINRLQVREKKIERKYESKLVKLENKAKRIVEKKLHSGNGHEKCQTYKRFAEKCKQGAIPKHVVTYVCQPSAPQEDTVKPSSEERHVKKDSSSEKHAQVQYENLLTTDVPSVDAATILIPDKTVAPKESSSEIVQQSATIASEDHHSPADMDAVPVDSKISPVHILKGQIVTKRWQVVNNGLYPWTDETELRYSWGSSALVPLQLSVKCPKLKPGEVGCIEVIMQAQDLSGCFEAYWHFYHKGIRFGHWLYCSYITDADYCSHIIASGTGTPCLTSVSTMEEMKKIEIEASKIQAQIDSIESKPSVCESGEKTLNNNSLKSDGMGESTGAEKEMKTNQLDSPKNSVTVKNGFETDLNNFSEPKEKLKVSPAVSETKNSDSDNISIISESSVESNEDFVIVPCSQYQSDYNSETAFRDLFETDDNDMILKEFANRGDILEYLPCIPDPKNIPDAQEYIRFAWSAIGGSSCDARPTESVTYLHDEFLYKLRTMKSHLFLEAFKKPIEYNLIFDPIKDIIKSERIKHEIEDLAYPRALSLPAVCFNDDKTLIYFKDILRPDTDNEDILRQEPYASVHIKDKLRTPISYSNIFREKPTIVTCDKLKQLLMKDINSSLGIASEWSYPTDIDTDCKRKLESPVQESRNDNFIRAACSNPNDDCNKLRDQLKAKKRRSKDCKTSPKAMSEPTSAGSSKVGIESGKQNQESVFFKCEEQSTQTTELPNSPSYLESQEASRKFIFTSQGFGFEAPDYLNASPFANKGETLPKSSSSRYSYVFTQPNGNPIPTSENGSQTDEISRVTPPTTGFVEDASQPVHILPESLMTGAVNAASTAFNTARTVFDMFRGSEEEMNLRGFQTPVEQPTNNNRSSRRSGSCSPTRMSTVQCLDILHDMGFTNKEVNLKFLHKYNNDLNTVISKLL